MSRPLRTEKQPELNLFEEDITLNYDADDIMADMNVGSTPPPPPVVIKVVEAVTQPVKKTLSVPTPLPPRARSLSPQPKVIPGPIIEEKKEEPTHIPTTAAAGEEEEEEDEEERELRLKLEKKKKDKAAEVARKKKEEHEKEVLATAAAIAKKLKKEQEAIEAAEAAAAAVTEEKKKQQEEAKAMKQADKLKEKKKKEVEAEEVEAGWQDLLAKNKICEEEEAPKRAALAALAEAEMEIQDQQQSITMDVNFEEEIRKVGERIDSAPSSPALQSATATTVKLLEIDTSNVLMEDFLPKTPLHGAYLLHSPQKNRSVLLPVTSTPSSDEALSSIQLILETGWIKSMAETKALGDKIARKFDELFTILKTTSITTEKPKATRKRKTTTTTEETTATPVAKPVKAPRAKKPKASKSDDEDDLEKL